MTYNIFYFHGWSYDATFFYDLARELEYPAFFYNRGYFTSAFTPFVTPQGNNIAVTHSVGLFFLLQHYNFSDFKKIIILSGFTKFSVSEKILESMQKGLLKNPLLILKKFRKNAGDFSDFKTNHLNVALLSDDLELLKHYDASNHLKHNQQKIYHIHGTHDKIIPYSACGMTAHSYLVNAGHVFPLEKNMIERALLGLT